MSYITENISSTDLIALIFVPARGSLLSSKNLTGNIPSSVAKLTGLVEL